jgi:hypothetical protein
MKHPTSERWMSFLYGESAPQERLELESHLQTCAECQSRLNTWRGSMTALDAWTVPQAPRRARPWPLLKWAAAAAVVLGLGVGLGRLSFASSTEFKNLAATLRQDFDQRSAATRAGLMADLKREQLAMLQQAIALAAQSASAETQRVLATFAESDDGRRPVDAQELAIALQRLEAQWAARFAALRRELETVAMFTEDSFDDTEEKLVRLAGFTQPSPSR